MPSVNGVRIIACPHCGDQPSVSTTGSCIDIECCASMMVQKSDMLTFHERTTWNNQTFLFSPEVEEKALRIAAAMWNKRQ